MGRSQPDKYQTSHRIINTSMIIEIEVWHYLFIFKNDNLDLKDYDITL